jgi:Holliday junction resolvase RusA-like endonuclease
MKECAFCVSIRSKDIMAPGLRLRYLHTRELKKKSTDYLQTEVKEYRSTHTTLEKRQRKTKYLAQPVVVIINIIFTAPRAYINTDTFCDRTRGYDVPH